MKILIWGIAFYTMGVLLVLMQRNNLYGAIPVAIMVSLVFGLARCLCQAVDRRKNRNKKKDEIIVRPCGKTKKIVECIHCGYLADRFFDKCPRCNERGKIYHYSEIED